MNLFLRVYYGVPRFTGEVFRATKLPSILLIIGFIGIPVALSVSVAVAAIVLHSTLPYKIMAAGFLQMVNPAHRHAQPEMFKLLDVLTPRQLALGRYIVYLLILDAVLLFFVLIWFRSRLSKFLSQRRRHE